MFIYFLFFPSFPPSQLACVFPIFYFNLLKASVHFGSWLVSSIFLFRDVTIEGWWSPFCDEQTDMIYFTCKREKLFIYFFFSNSPIWWRFTRAAFKTREGSQPHLFKLLLMHHQHYLISWPVLLWLTGEREHDTPPMQKTQHNEFAPGHRWVGWLEYHQDYILQSLRR